MTPALTTALPAGVRVLACEGEAWGDLPVVGDVEALAPVLDAATLQTEAGVLCEEALAVADAGGRGEVAVERIAGAGQRASDTAAVRQERARGDRGAWAETEEGCEAAAEDAVHAVAIADVVAADRPGAVIADLLIRLEGAV